MLLRERSPGAELEMASPIKLLRSTPSSFTLHLSALKSFGVVLRKRAAPGALEN